ncbi:uncharacterized protein At2g27730, mitochondrial-like isoform X2 [Salvia miltiorrhiza]|uniref:uncharacterized protein At2g27730, mitochondrial-like isoform X2 n=1 Tax=Salvia miltiorrhiza TaxID=226208 RepID=UPI0025ABC6F1|nr:uncharacterized protein At2g27730, mitochondrial-like isoform X2 [Salvia miltiorrhiza]
MTLRSVVSCSRLCRLMEGSWRPPASSLRYFSESKGRVLSEEERAIETVYIQKMERERMEKLRRKKAEQEKADNDKSEKAEEGPHKS